MMERGAGILLHITSLPGRFGIGTFGESAFQFVEFLTKSGQKYWQILPLGPTGYGDSPYQSFSSHGINPNLIDFDMMERDGLLEKHEYENWDFKQDDDKRDFTALLAAKLPKLQIAFERGWDRLAEEIKAFSAKNAYWLDDYALYMALKYYFDGQEWRNWEEGIRRREPDALKWYRAMLSHEVNFWRFIQYIAYRQWRYLKDFANARGISIIGDIPIYAAYDSADTWAHASTGIFKFDCDLNPVGIAGCPPDYFTPDGQYWGNPVYDWERNRQTGYVWWIQRIRTSFLLYDMVRIDHFRGLESYWEIPGGSATAAYGHWEPGPGIDLIDAIRGELGDVPMIAEDLGLLTPEVFDLKEKSQFPGMKVLQFAFDGYSGNTYLPHNFERNCVVYTGTHDNDTTVGWFEKAGEQEKERAIKYFNLTEEEGYHWGMVRGAMSSVADIAIIPLQDILGLSSQARMNTPSTVGGSNWKWSVDAEAFTDMLAERLGEMTRRYAR